MMGVIHNAEYLRWFEQGRLQILFELLPLDEALGRAVAMPVVRNECSHRKAVRYGDPLVLITTHELLPAYEGTMTFAHSLVHEKNKVEMAHGQTVTTLLDMKTGQLVKEWPPDLWRRYQELR